MRAIKFRGKSVHTGEWHYVDLIQPTSEVCYIQPRETAGYMLIPETVGQFTGLYDKNGKEIYEGDIFVCGQWTALVSWNKELATFALRFDFENKVGCTPLGEWQTMAIVGNIHDNPELIKEVVK